jgi:hypothetical protein
MEKIILEYSEKQRLFNFADTDEPKAASWVRIKEMKSSKAEAFCNYMDKKYTETLPTISTVISELNLFLKNMQVKCYLMVDGSTGYVKIGKSKNPLKREKTLQAEKPTIKMLHYFENNHEKELHQKYSDKRLRGEWFNITPKEVKEIINNYN